MTASVALIGLRLNCQCVCKHGSLAEIHFRATVTPAGWRGLNPFTPRRDRRLSALHMKCLPPPYYSCFPDGVRVHPRPPPFPAARASVVITWGLIQPPTRACLSFLLFRWSKPAGHWSSPPTSSTPSWRKRSGQVSHILHPQPQRLLRFRARRSPHPSSCVAAGFD